VNRFNNLGVFGVLGFVLAVWLIYLSIEVAKHVAAWPFG
jgi:hypothetical protein